MWVVVGGSFLKMTETVDWLIIFQVWHIFFIDCISYRSIIIPMILQECGQLIYCWNQLIWLQSAFMHIWNMLSSLYFRSRNKINGFSLKIDQENINLMKFQQSNQLIRSGQKVRRKQKENERPSNSKIIVVCVTLTYVYFYPD